MNKIFLLIFIYGSLLLWTIFSIYYINRLRRDKTTKNYNPYLYSSIPSIFTTIGILGTFGGIFIGLQNFDVSEIDKSIPNLLEGMKSAFVTSIIGIICSLIFKVIGQLVLNQVEGYSTSNSNQLDELSALNHIIRVLELTQAEAKDSFIKLNHSMIGNNKNSLSEEILNNQKILLSILNNSDKNLNQLDEIDVNQNKIAQQMQVKFDSFSKILNKNNADALVGVMKNATEAFNKQMSELLDKLVKENFQELNKSVQYLNTWQKENKSMILSLTNQFKDVSDNLSVSASTIKSITKNTDKLIGDNGELSELIKELQKVLIEDTKYQKMINHLEDTVKTLKLNTETFDETTNKLNDWISKEHNFKESIDILINRLTEIEKIKDINGDFWSNTKTQMEEGINILVNSSNELRGNLDNISEEFTEQLNLTLTSLDELIQRLIAKANK